MTASAYPLSWPAGWKRTAPAYRTRSKFGKASRYEGYGDHKRWVPGRDLTIAEATDRVVGELSRMGLSRERRADGVIISTNLRLRQDGLPMSGQREPEDPGAAVYWTDSLQKQRVMAIDLYDRVADNLAAVAATLEAMRAIERHGGAIIMERAFTGFTALPAPIVAGMKRDWQVVLGLQELLQPKAEDVDKAYKRLAMQHHPDRGGDPAKMAELNAARDEALMELGS